MYKLVGKDVWNSSRPANSVGCVVGCPEGLPVMMIMQYLRVDMSMMLMWFASVIVGCDGKRSRFSDTRLYMT